MAVQRIPIFIDDFGDGSQDLPVLSGNGTVSEAGGALVVAATTGQNMDWWTWGRNGKLPYVGVPVVSDYYTKIYYEFTINSWTTIDANYSHLVVGPAQDDVTLWFLYTANGTTFNVYRNWATGSLGTITTTLPRKFRFVWNRIGGTMSVQCQTGVSPIVWTDMVTEQAVSMTPVRFGFGLKNWNYFPACSAQFEDVEIYAEDFQQLTSDPSGIEDSLVLPSAGGLAGTGPTFEGWLHNEATSAGLEDSVALPSASGLADQMTDIPEGALFSEPEGLEDDSALATFAPTPNADASALEDTYYAEAYVPTYVRGKTDGDGKELLGYTAVRQVLAYDATQDPWHMHGADHYGAGRDGVIYYDGVACGPASFGTLAGGINRTAWAARDGYLDFSWDAVPTISADGEMTCTVTTTNSGTGLSSCFRWFLTGDFDIQLEYQIITHGSGPSDNGLVFLAYLDDRNCFYVRRRMFGGDYYDKDVYNNGSWSSYASVGTSDTSGKLRLVRVGSVVSSYYWSGSSWTQIGGNYTMTYNRPVWLQIHLYETGGSSTTSVVQVRNFTINSGATTNLIGWAREAAGTYRGSQAEFPQHAIISSSGNGFDIIDADTSKLWMSFRGGTNNFIGGDANYYIRQVGVKDGVLFVAYRTFDTYGITDGWAAWIDFTLDFMRVVRGPTYGDAGLIYNVELSTGVWPRDSANGSISWRNSARGFFSSYSANWLMQNSRANWCDLLHDSGFQYRAVASNGGVMVQKWARWKFEGAGNAHLNTPDKGTSTKTTAMQWVMFDPLDKALYYHDRSKLYAVPFSTWSAGLGGSWVENREYAFSGTLDNSAMIIDAQDKLVFYGGYLWYARIEGVYQMDPASGVSVLFYGKPGSGATHEILPSYSVIASIHQTGSLLAVGMQHFYDEQVWTQVALVDQTTNALYGLAPATKGRSAYSVAV